MKKLTPEEYNSMSICGIGNSSEFFSAISGLKVGESLFISKKEYYLSRGPGRICRSIMKRYKNIKYEFGKLSDGSGWAIKRIS